MSSKFRVSFTVNDPAPTVINKLNMGTGSPIKNLTNLRNYIDQMISGVTSCKAYVATTAVSASQTGTFTGDPTAGQALTINGVTFTARASGAVANEFNIAAGDVTTTAANLAAAINASVTAKIANEVIASSALGVVTVTAVVPGSGGNLFTITENLDNFTLVGTTLAGGSEDATGYTISHGL